VQDLLPVRRTVSGYSLLEMLVGLLVISFLLTVIYPVFTSLSQLMRHQKYRYQDEIGIYQLQIRLACNQITEVNEDEILYYTSESESEIHLLNGNLISQPGWLCFLYDIDEAYFFVRKGIVYLEYERNGESYEYPIAYWQP